MLAAVARALGNWRISWPRPDTRFRHPVPARRPPTRGPAAIQLVITEGLRLANLERALSKGATRSPRGRITVASAEPMPTTGASRRGGARERRPARARCR